MEASRRNLIAISFSQFVAAFSGNFVTIFLPFYILKISPYPLERTLLWVGAIMGSNSLCAAATSTFWGSLTHRFNPKLLYIRSILVNTLTFLLMSFTHDLHLLLILRILQGLATGTSTIGLIIVSSASPREKVSANIGFFQSALTLGQLVGPPVGSLAAAALGYKGALISASVILFAAVIFCYLNVTDIPRLPKEKKASGWAAMDKRVMIAWMLCFITIVQLTFLPSVLPKVLESLEIEHPDALKLAGVVVMLYTATAIIGTYFWSQLSKRIEVYRLITFLFAFSILFQIILAFCGGVISFTVVRMVQTGFVAATFPLIISIFASELKGSKIGFLNSSRFAGNALGPFIATSVLAVSNLTSLYFFVAALTFFVLLTFKLFFK